ncbi:MAG: sulfatase-like hydrolase/transferase, partial [Planctomycetota bacterium]
GLDFETPRLNRMAKDGIRFSRAYASPVCTPSRVSMHTGLYVTRHNHTGVLPVHKGTEQKVDFTKMPTFAQLLRSKGYQTSTTGKWQLATIETWPNHLRESGFDSWCVWQIWKDGAKTLRHWTPTFNQDGDVRDDIADQFGPDVLIDYVIDKMRTASKANESFLIVHNELLPHDPIIGTPDDRKVGRPATLGNMINYMDKLVGRVLDEIESMGIRDNTYVVFMGDNGTHDTDFKNPDADQPGQRAHTRHTKVGLVNGGKFQLGDAGTHVPLIIWGPKSIPAGSVCEELVDVVDLFPTFCELSGTEIPDSLSIDGRSVAPQIHGRSGTPRAWVHHGISGKGINVFDGTFRYFTKGQKLWDARDLPNEPVSNLSDAESKRAKTRLSELAKTVATTQVRPPLPFQTGQEFATSSETRSKDTDEKNQ